MRRTSNDVPLPHKDEDLRQLAQDLRDGLLFVKQVGTDDVERYFLDLQMMRRRQVQQYLATTDWLYQHRVHQLQPGVDLYPYCTRLSRADATAFWHYVAELERMRDTL